ncbi:sigma-70 family RNA polymerase sigma factor [Pseudorhodoferax soli]|uniref:RNA polymerase sigma-70 factor (ECF subfamily) n=1 Tax=Pseudorhodoferax soli TaxID=545864 RepID=A0A368XB80_9BURK|nr:sigma-70 family RNA polymerase sigma factor [Pseudorhodoferax soli]RCW65221.1 RNA polymerase sigma-70 factor (ECF subfamily) [Pseudorhodoferax soli]
MADAHPDGSPRQPPAARAHLHVVPQEGPAAPQQILAWMQAVAELADRQAFAQLFAFYAPRVKAYLVRSGTEPCLAEEIAQDALLLLWRKAALFDAKRASVGTWLFTIARNLRVDRLRGQGAALVHADATELDDVADDTPPVDERLHTAQLCARMRVVLRTMPAEQARVLRLCYFEDQPHTRIASTLGLPLGTVKSRMRAALAHLRRALQDGGPAP